MTPTQEVRWEPTLPNKITFGRIVMTVPIVLAHKYGLYHWATLLFIIACVSDLLDGWLARILKCSSEWGHLCDPVADKLVCASAAIIGIAEFGHNPYYLVPILLIFGYDALVIWMRKRVRFMPTNKWAKRKTAFLMAGLIASLLSVSVDGLLVNGWFGIRLIFGYSLLVGFMYATLWIATGFACVSIYVYAREYFLARVLQNS